MSSSGSFSFQLCPGPPAQNQTSICGLRRISPSPKIKFGFTCQPRNPNTEASRSLSSFAQSPNREAWQVARCSASRLPFPFLAARQAALPATLSCVSNGRCSRSTAIR
jgi:hypothetical protein